jgi:transposase
MYRVDQVRKRPLSVRQARHLLLVPPDQQTAWQAAYCTRLWALDPVIAHAYSLVQTFAMLVRQRAGVALNQWLDDVAASGITELKTFAQGLQHDYAAVKAGLTLEWSNVLVDYSSVLPPTYR